MTVISSKEFVANQKRYFNLAINEETGTQKRKNMSQLAYKNGDSATYDELLEPDDDFRRAISMDELRKRIKEDIHQIYSSKK